MKRPSPRPKLKSVERHYAGQLSKIADHVGMVVRVLSGKPDASERIGGALAKYADALEVWAESAAAKMLFDVGKSDERAWRERSAEIGRGLAKEIAEAPTGDLMRAKLAEQVTLIKSLPINAAQRVHDLAIKAVADGSRAGEIAAEIMRTGEVTRSRAVLIARTEVARTASALTQARAEHVGSEGYLWETAGDSAVRDDHAELDGRYFRWDSPPIADKRTGARAHPGGIYNCRCVASPVIPEYK